MKYRKNGSLKLERGDVRVGNFVFSLRGDSLRVCDINTVADARVSQVTSNGMMLRIAMEQGQNGYLENYAALVYAFLCTVPDKDFMENVMKECVAAMQRRPELYNAVPVSDDEDEKILREQQALMDEQERMKEKLERDIVNE